MRSFEGEAIGTVKDLGSLKDRSWRLSSQGGTSNNLFIFIKLDDFGVSAAQLLPTETYRFVDPEISRGTVDLGPLPSPVAAHNL